MVENSALSIAFTDLQCFRISGPQCRILAVVQGGDNQDQNVLSLRN